MILRSLFLFVSLFFFLEFKAQDKDFEFDVDSQQTFDMLAGVPLSSAFAGVSSVKLVYHLQEQKLYFIQSKKYPLHYNFCREIFGNTELPEFNNFNYRDNPYRQYILATLNYFRDGNKFTLEFSPADNIRQESVEFMYHMVTCHFFGKKQLFLQLNTQTLLKHTTWNIPVIRMSELFGWQKIQIIQRGKASGKFLIVSADSLQFLGDVKNCILLIKGNSNDIPLCKGIIITSFQTPLSHISILSQNRKTPLLALKAADEVPALQSLVNQTVEYTVLQDTFLLQVDSMDTYVGDNIDKPLTRLPFDTTTRNIELLSKLRLKESGAYGVKAINLAQLQRVRYKGKRILTPEGAFAIPVYYYRQHLHNHGIDTIIDRILQDYHSFNKTELQARLQLVRELIMQGVVNPLLISEIESTIKAFGTNRRYRFRSSSNAEDLEGFNGAGLYTSETGILGKKSKSVDQAVKKVWASLWSERAFEERCLVRIDQKTIGMAVLAHRSFPDEYANGVAITRNLYRDFEFGFVVNMQAGDNSLVLPTGNETCEQFISYFNSSDPFFNEKESIEYFSFSSLNNNQPLLTNQEVFELTQQLDKIKRKFYRKLKAWKSVGYKDFAMDVEFKAELVDGKKVFYFKQARPFR